MEVRGVDFGDGIGDGFVGNFGDGFGDGFVGGFGDGFGDGFVDDGGGVVFKASKVV
jgi:hypothetical protein